MTAALQKTFEPAAVSKPKRPAPFSLRLTEAEKVMLQKQAGDQKLGTYIRGQILGDRKRRTKGISPQDAARMLGLLGQSDIWNSLKRLADAAEIGALPIDNATLDEIYTALAAVMELRAGLLVALASRKT